MTIQMQYNSGNRGGSIMRADELSVLEEFLEHAEQWIKETSHLSSTERFFNEHHRKIVEMGEAVVPILLADLVDGLEKPEGPTHWFWALKLITEEDPVPEKDRGLIEPMALAWIEWGRKNGKIKKDDQVV